MRASRTRRYYIACPAARAAAFLFLPAYALWAPGRFAADLASGPRRLTPITVLWLLLMAPMAFRLFLRWELTYYRRGERFFASSNEALRCGQCREHLCRYKRTRARKLSRH